MAAFSPLPPLLIGGPTCFPPGVTPAGVGVETCGQGLGTVRTGTPMGLTTGELLEPPDPENEEDDEDELPEVPEDPEPLDDLELLDAPEAPPDDELDEEPD
jgi:hypothetical protein